MPFVFCLFLFRMPEVLDLSLFIGIKSFSQHGYGRICSGPPKFAGMVELVDAADSKSAGGNPLRVQVSLSVPKKTRRLLFCNRLIFCLFVSPLYHHHRGWASAPQHRLGYPPVCVSGETGTESVHRVRVGAGSVSLPHKHFKNKPPLAVFSLFFRFNKMDFYHKHLGARGVAHGRPPGSCTG